MTHCWLLAGCALLLASGAGAAEYVTLDFDFSADVAEVPSRSMLTKINIGVPILRRSLMVDFERSDIELEDCIKKQSYTYDQNDTSDVVLFEEEHITDARARASFRFTVREHCEDVGQLGDRYYKNCLSDECQGILGLSRLSPFWSVWSAFTLGLDGLKLGNDHPRLGDVGIRSSPVVQCRSDTKGVCDFDAMVSEDGGPRRYRVQFHAENSYTYLPVHLFERFEDYELDAIDLLDPDPATGHSLVLRLDRRVLMHTPDPAHAHSSPRRNSATSFFSQHTRASETMLAKPWANDSAISIGNAVLTHYTLHVDLVQNRATFELRVRREHLTVITLAMATVLFFLLMRSVCLSTYEMAWLSNGLPVSCACGNPANHTTPSDATFHWLAALAVLLLSMVAAADSAQFLDELLDLVLFYSLLGFNWIVLGLQLAVPVQWQRYLHSHGRYSKAQFRRVFVFSFPLETLIVVSLCLLLSTVRQDSFGTFGTFFVSLFGLFNSWRYAQYWLVSPQAAVAPVLLLVVNLFLFGAVLVWRVVYDFLLSWPLTLALVLLVILTSSVSVDRHARIRLRYVLLQSAQKEL